MARCKPTLVRGDVYHCDACKRFCRIKGDPAKFGRMCVPSVMQEAHAKAMLARANGEKREPCQHRGESIGLKDCEGCQGTVRIKLYACAIHGECTLGKKLDGIATCAQCPDYAPSKRDESPDDGRSG